MRKTPWDEAKERLEEAVAKIHIDPLLVARLTEPDRVIEMSLPMRLDEYEAELERARRHVPGLGREVLRHLRIGEPRRSFIGGFKDRRTHCPAPCGA